MSIMQEDFGTLSNGTKIIKYILTNNNGVSASFTNFGAIWISMNVPDRNGNIADVVLGYDTLEGYLKNPAHFGAPIGRNSNRMGGAKFTLNDVEYKIEANNNRIHNLHSGPDYYRLRVWNTETETTDLGDSVIFSLESPNMDQGYPANLSITVRYTLTEDNSIIIEYTGIADEDTIFNMTNHSYFNLAGHNNSSILDHYLKVNADSFTATDEDLIVTGEIISVVNTPMDFRKYKKIGTDIKADYIPLILANGYDHNYLINTIENEPLVAAELYDEKSGRLMKVHTDLPGVHIYSGNSLTDQEAGKEGTVYSKHSAICFETQFVPNAMNLLKFRKPILKAGEEFSTTTIYEFTTK
jgi:Galactose mutarotase and related enzymes